jgi:WD40 repeat protein
MSTQELVSANKIRQIATTTVEGNIWSLALSPDDQFFCVGCNEGLLYFVNTANQQVYQKAVLSINSSGYPAKHIISSIAFAKSKELILTAGRLGVIIVDYKGTSVFEYPLEGWLSPVIKLSNNEKFFAVSDDDRVMVFRFENNKKLFEFRVDKNCIGITFSKDDKYLYVGSKEGKAIQKWSLESGALEFEWPAHTGIILQLAINSDDTQLISSGEDFKLKRWDLATGVELPVSGFANGKENAVRFSSDYSLLGTASLSRIVSLRHPESLEMIWHESFENYVTALDFSKDDKYLIAGDDRGVLKMWMIE